MCQNVFQAQRDYHGAGNTLPRDFRMTQLKRLERLIREHEDQITAAIHRDTGRPASEIYTSEIVTTRKDLRLAIRNLDQWLRPERVKTPFLLQPGRSRVLYEPYGVALIMAPWNYPFQLLLTPLVGAMAAGNCVVLKPSEHAPETRKIVTDIIEQGFEQQYIHVAQGGPETARALLQLDFDYVFFTGGPEIGREVMRAAADHLTPVTLELGGKCPCIVAADADIKKAARRITWGKFFNAGQTCLAPDYVFAHASVKTALVRCMRDRIREFYGDDPSQSPDYGRMIHGKHFDRVMALLNNHPDLSAGADRERLYIPPRIIDDPDRDSDLMTQEIFGPLLPVLDYRRLEEVTAHIRAQPKPLAVYLFTASRMVRNTVTERTSSGSVTVNDVLLQAASPYLPFGGVGKSGMGRYRGKSSFITFSNRKAVLQRGLIPDWTFRYPPYPQNMQWLKRVFKFV